MNKKQLVSRLTEFANSSWAYSKKITHSHKGVVDEYPCANPNGPVDNSSCPEDDPLCNCPCQELKPDSDEEVNRINEEITGIDQTPIDIGGPIGDITNSIWSSAVTFWNSIIGEDETTITSSHLKEPTEKNLKRAERAIKECDLIKEHLDEDWLGCLWSETEHPSSCNCPCIGPKFKDYLEYTRTYSTYWDTPDEQPLLRNAQMQLITSQKAQMTISGDLTLRPGTMIFINELKEGGEGTIGPKKIGGRWLVASITHSIGAFPVAHGMMVDLIRDTTVFDPDEEPKLWESIWDLIKSWI